MYTSLRLPLIRDMKIDFYRIWLFPLFHFLLSTESEDDPDEVTIIIKRIAATTKIAKYFMFLYLV